MFHFINLYTCYFILVVNECTRLDIKQKLNLKLGWGSKILNGIREVKGKESRKTLRKIQICEAGSLFTYRKFYFGIIFQ